MRQLEEYFHAIAPATLFHYTGIGSVLGMSKTRTLWASSAYYLNDSREVIHACSILDEVLEPRMIFGNLIPADLEFLTQLKEWKNDFQKNHYNIFIFSLSEKKSLLSQWRSYTPHGKGVSVGFQPATIQNIALSSSSVLAKCIYDRSQQSDLIRSLIDKVLTTFKQRESTLDISNRPKDQCYFEFLEEFRGDFLKVLCIIKHPSFSEEREWRLISPYYERYTTSEIKFREGASMLVPYIELELPPEGPIFETVVLGPSQHQSLSFSALSMYLSNQALCNRTENSQIPYREW